MSQPPKPCAHCGNANFYVLPNVLIDFGTATTVMGMQAVTKRKNVYLAMTFVNCTQCGFSMQFCSNTQDMGQYVPGATMSAGVAP